MISIVPEYNKSFHPLSIPKCSPWAYLSMDFFFFPKKNTGVGCQFLLQGIFLTQGSNPCFLYLLYCRQILFP